MTVLVLKTLYPVDDISTLDWTRSKHPRHWELYNSMQDLSIESFNTNMTGSWDLVDIRRPSLPNLADAFIHTMRLTSELYAKYRGTAAILYADPDILCLRPTSSTVWESFRDFRSFASPSVPIPFESDIFWNCSLRLFPQGLPESFWFKLKTLINTWDRSRYGYEQWVYWKMMWEQEPPIDRHNPNNKMMWTAWPPGASFEKSLVPLRYNFIHVSASSNPETSLAIMKKIWRYTNK